MPLAQIARAARSGRIPTQNRTKGRAPMQDCRRITSRPASPPASARAFLALLPDLRRSARRLTRSGEDADDLVQDTLLRVWSRLALTRTGATDAAPITDLRAYAFATLRNCARTRAAGALSADQRLGPDDPRGDIDAQPDSRADPGLHMAATDALRALAQLPRDQQILLRLRAIDGLSYAEIAARTGLPMGTVTSRLSRGRHALRAALGLPDDAAVSDLLGRRG